MKINWIVFFFALLVISNNAQIAYANKELISADSPLINNEKEQFAQNIMDQVRCFVCRGQTVLSSDAKMAKSLRIMIREQVMLNKNEDEILNYISSIYGEQVLLSPPFNFKTYLLWTIPFAVPLLVLLSILILRRKSRNE